MIDVFWWQCFSHNFKATCLYCFSNQDIYMRMYIIGENMQISRIRLMSTYINNRDLVHRAGEMF